MNICSIILILIILDTTYAFSQKSKIIFMRGFDNGAETIFVHINDREVFEIAKNSIHEFECKVGEYSLNVSRSGESKLIDKSIEIDSNEVKYVQIINHIDYDVNLWDDPFVLNIDNQEAFFILSTKDGIEMYKHLNDIKNGIIDDDKLKNTFRIGAFLSLPLNFISTSEVGFVENNSSGIINCQYGLGILVSYNYGNKYDFELSIADMSFSKNTMNEFINLDGYKCSFTPSYVITFKNKSYLINTRIRLGVGLDYYFQYEYYALIDGNFSKPVNTDEWNLNNNIGFHTKATLDLVSYETILLSIGLSYNYAVLSPSSNRQDNGKTLPDYFNSMTANNLAGIIALSVVF